MINPPKRLLYGPGPTMVEPRVYDAMAKPIVGHLDPYFFSVVEDIRAGLRTAFGTKNEFTFAISGTGSAGMEAAVSNFVEPGTKMVVFANGFFCDRITEMGKRHGANVIRCERPWGETFEEQEVRDAIRREKPQVVAYVQAETSTGVFNAGKAIARPRMRSTPSSSPIASHRSGPCRWRSTKTVSISPLAARKKA